MSDQSKNPDPSQITYKDYTVQAGDSLQTIAKTELGDARLSTPLYKLNKKVIGSDPDRLRPGMILRIPELPQAKSEPEPEQKQLSSYEFDDVNVWGHRWVNLMRAIKTTMELAEYSAADSTSAEIIVANDDDDEFIDDEDYVDESVDEDGRTFEEVETVDNTSTNRSMSAVEKDTFSQVEKLQNQIIRNLLTNLARFVDIDMGKYIALLTPPRWQPAEGRQRPPSALLHSVSRNISRDLEISSNALQNRLRSGKTKEATLQARTLFLADTLSTSALASLQPFLKSEAIVNTITYLSGNIHIRQIPYDEGVILIGLPYASVSVWHDQKAYDELADFDEDILASYKNRLPFDFMAIPHEIGHFIYHFGEMPHATIAQFFGPKYLLPSKYSGWREEIFADCVGCFIAGPLAVLGMQSLLSGTYDQELLRDDGHHPIAAVRPFIMSQILRRLGDHYGFPVDFDHAPDKLDENWWHHLKIVGAVPADASPQKHKFKFTLHGNHDDNLPAHHHNNRHAKYHAEEKPEDEYLLSKAGQQVKTTVAKLQKEVNGIIDAFIHLLLFKADMSKLEMWSGDLTADQSLEAYEADLQKLLNIELGQLPEVQAARDEISDEERKKLYAGANQFETEKELLRALRAWGDSGPGGWGAHP
ncbi:MAG: LysM peptidoglycan-binding domain-containing protein [Anaerolineae bacterium]